MEQGRARRSQVESGGAKRSQEVPSRARARKSQRELGRARRSQTDLGVARRSKEEPREARWSQEEPRGAGRCQAEPGGDWQSQAEPEGARMSQDKRIQEVLGFPCLPLNPVDSFGSDCSALKAPLAAPCGGAQDISLVGATTTPGAKAHGKAGIQGAAWSSSRRS